MAVKLVAGLFVLVVVGLTSFVETRQPRIFGGNEAQPHEFPYMAVLYREAKPQYYCGSAILNENWVITAAHCQLPDNQTILVKVGKHSIKTVEDTEQEVEVCRVIVHEEYRGPFDGNDIALLKLSKPLILNDYVKPIALPEKNCDFTGQMIFTGWGDMENNRMPDKLQKAVLPIIDIDVCQLADDLISNQSSPIDANKMLCTGPLTGEISLCQGDSGGPLVKRDSDGKSEIVGVASFTLDSCGRPITATVHTRVSYYVDWVKDVMNRY